MTARDDQKEKRRQEILFAGLNLFIQKGYSGTTIKDIASAVGMSTGLLFHYFPSKESLYLTLVTLGIEGPMSSVQPTREEPLAFFEATAERILTYIKEEPFFAKMFVLMHQAYYSADVPAGVKEMLTGFDVYTPTAEIIRQGQANGTIRDGNPLALAIAFWSAIQGVAETLAMHTNLPCPEGRWVTDLLRKETWGKTI
ncbi:MAG: TetR/AcrR family transcriptional regulator [Clostridiales bacterium]|nr:TetR/AcrR family transcriptional regulator [Clostridiales bacterium]